MGRPTAYTEKTASEICACIAQGASLAQACAELGVVERTAYRWMFAHQDFRQDLMRARGIRGDFTFGEQILDIADDTSEDWLRSRVRIGVRQLQMSRLHPQTWGDKLTVGIKNDVNLLSEDERRRRAEELIAMIKAIKAPPELPPALEEAPEKLNRAGSVGNRDPLLGGSADDGRGITTVTPTMLMRGLRAESLSRR